jgi:hypothetical protein
MHSTTGIGITFVSFYCLIGVAIISTLARIAQKALLRKRAANGERVGSGKAG